VTPADLVFEYHSRTAHRLSKYASGPETLDWTEQPNPFREFAGSPRVSLPLDAGSVTARFGQIYEPGSIASMPLSFNTLGAFLQLSMGLTAWKEYGPDRWPLRVNPSSGNLHPTEAYAFCLRIEGIENGLYHYVSRDHSLEQRCSIATANGKESGLWIALSSIHWREAWKYGERAFRYCQLDVGHAIGALRYGAAALGWRLRAVHPYPHECLMRLLGLHRDEDFCGAEKEDAEVLLEVAVSGPAQQGPPVPVDSAHETWTGKANVIDHHPMYHWPVIDRVAAATQQTAGSSHADASEEDEARKHPPLMGNSLEPAMDVILRRRSAQRFDPKFTMTRQVFLRLMDSLLVGPAVPWDVWSFVPRIHPLLFAHRVEGMEPGLYALLRRPGVERELRRALSTEFLWQRPDSLPEHLPLFLLQRGDYRQLAKTLSCHQAIAADGCFSVAMLSEFGEIVNQYPWRYRQLHWEAGLLGQVLYLEAEAAGLRGTGIGCYFDDSVQELLGLRGKAFASLYHFTVGSPALDERISTSSPYPERYS